MLGLVLAIGTYRLVENPIRHSRTLMTRRWASVGTGLCLIASSLAVTTFEVHRYSASGTTTTDANAAAGTACPLPTKRQIQALHFAPGSVRRSTGGTAVPLATRMVVVGDSTACTLMIGLAAVGPAYGIQVESGAVIGCGIVSGRMAPYYYNGVDLEAYTRTCQSRARAAEAAAFRLGTARHHRVVEHLRERRDRDPHPHRQQSAPRRHTPVAKGHSAEDGNSPAAIHCHRGRRRLVVATTVRGRRFADSTHGQRRRLSRA